MTHTDGRPGSLYDRLGGRATLERVHGAFYAALLAHPWLGGFFVGVPRAQLESQQTDFMASLMGGPRVYAGRMPRDAHVHLFITAAVFDLRHTLLRTTLESAGIPEALRAEWLAIDASFRAVLVKERVEECHGRFALEPVIVVPDPRRAG